MQEAKKDKQEEVQEAVKAVASERDSLKAEVSTLTKKVTAVEAQLQQAAKEKKSSHKQASPQKAEAKVSAECSDAMLFFSCT